MAADSRGPLAAAPGDAGGKGGDDDRSSPSRWAARFSGPRAAPVALNVYWLRRVQLDGQGRMQKSLLGATGGLSWARMLADTAIGAYHVGIEVHGAEFSFGTTRALGAQRLGGEASGVFRHALRQPGPRYAFREAVPLGSTDLGVAEVEQTAALLGITDFCWTSYCSLGHNCADFAEALAARLGAEPPPTWCRRGALLARALGLGGGCSRPSAEGGRGPGLCHSGGSNCKTWTFWNYLCGELTEGESDGSIKRRASEDEQDDEWDSLPDLSEATLVVDSAVVFQPSCALTTARSFPEPFMSSSGDICGGNLQAAFCQPASLKTVQFAAGRPLSPQKAASVKQAWPDGRADADRGAVLTSQLRGVPCPRRTASSPTGLHLGARTGPPTRAAAAAAAHAQLAASGSGGL